MFDSFTASQHMRWLKSIFERSGKRHSLHWQKSQTILILRTMKLIRCRLMASRKPLELPIGVQIPDSQPSFRGFVQRLGQYPLEVLTGIRVPHPLPVMRRSYSG